jgi:iron complex transport system ATP-binding protein
VTAALSFADVCVRVGNRPVLDGVTAEISAATLTGILGPNGAGKTTLLRASIGLLPCCGGSIRIQNKPLAQWRRDARARAVAYLPQAGEARWPMRAADVAMLGRMPHRNRFAPPAPEDLAAVEDALARCDAARFADRRMDTLSSGECARVLLARALATQAPLLLADEPAAFLDPVHQFGVMELLQAEARRGAAVVVTLHDLALAAAFCDHLIVIDRGRVAAAGAVCAVLTDALLERVFSVAYLGPKDDNGRRLPIFRKI